MESTKLYTILESPRETSNLGSWEEHLGRFNVVIGYTSLGSILLRDPVSEEFLVLHPMRAGMNAKNYGPFDSVAAFESSVLCNPDFVAECLEPEKVAALESLHGPLDADQVYIPVPYPFLASEQGLDSYMKGQVWVFADLVRQTLQQL